MSEIRDFLQGIDEEYLVGLTNKGIVKRSHKDLETEQVVLEEQGEEIRGSIGDIKVTLKLPLTESICSCPSTSTCKHVIMTILAAKAAVPVETGGGAIEGKAEEDSGRRDAGEQEISTAKQLQGISADEVKKALGAKEWRAVLEQVRTQKPSKIEEGNFVTVQGNDGLTVKLAYPLAYSTCSVCHSDKICRHKAWAALSFLTDKGNLRPEELDQEEEEGSPDWDGADAAEVLKDIHFFLKELLFVGCSRSSPETHYGLERLAIRCHGAGLAALEGKFRTLAEQVKGFHERRAGISAQSILHGLTDCYFLAEETERTIEGNGNRQILGAFRTEYQDIPEKMLLGVGMRQFVSGTGYQGHTLYFLEEDTGIFYTYTVARPTIYETGKRNVNAGNEVPWGLPCTLAQLSRARILLRQGKANGERRLSSTSQASAELLGLGVTLGDRAQEHIFDDFEQLWREYKKRLETETDRLFLILPKAILDMHYEETAQRLVFWLQDFQGRRLRAQLTYSKQEETAIRSLERLTKKVEQGSAEVPIFFGRLYVEDGECTLYPIETLE